MSPALPPGPRLPALLQTVGWWTRPTAFLERCRARHGRRFTLRLLGQETIVMLSDPDELRELFTAPPDVLHPGEGARILEPLVGRHSVILLDEGEHLEQRKLVLPAFHGERIGRLAGLVREVAERETSAWPRSEEVVLHGRLQALTLEIILRAVFGLEPGPRLDALRTALTELLEVAAAPLTMLAEVQGWPLLRRRAASFERARARADALVFELLEERRRDAAAGDDVLALLLGARHAGPDGEPGPPMTDDELRDELMTLLVAGHETTASGLAWAFERLARSPEVLRRLVAEVDAGDGDAYLTATVQEALRDRPVLPNAAPRLVKREVTIGGWTYPPGVALAANAFLVHHDPAIYPDPSAFRPERFLDEPPGTYTWLPFGGGRRRCLGASFATLEMKAVLRAVLERRELRPGAVGAERARRRSITISPAGGAAAVLPEREAAGLAS